MDFFALNFEDVESKTFIVRLSFERVQSSAAHNFRRPTSSASWPSSAEATTRDGPRQKPLRPNAAPRGGGQRQRQGCRALALKWRRGGRQEQQWPGPQSGKHGPEIPSPTWST